MSRLLSLLVLLWAWSLPCTTVAAQKQPTVPDEIEHQHQVGLVIPDLSASLVTRAPTAPVTNPAFSIRLETKTADVLVPVPQQFDQVDAIVQGTPGKLLIVGKAGGGSVDVVAILDAAARAFIDTFMCYAPAISSDGYYVAFTKFFGPHSSPSPDHHSMIYSIARSPSENRPQGIPTEDDVDVGFALYPPGTGNSIDDNSNVPSEGAHTVGGSYLWQASQFFFGDRTGGKLQIVWVAIAHGMATVRSATIPQSELGPVRVDFPPRLAAADVEGDHVKLTIYSDRARQVDASLDDFANLGSINLQEQPKGHVDKLGIL